MKNIPFLKINIYNMKKFSEGINSFETSKEELIQNKIYDLIGNNIELRQVPYSQVDDMEVDPVSIEAAAKDIIEMLKKEGLI